MRLSTLILGLLVGEIGLAQQALDQDGDDPGARQREFYQTRAFPNTRIPPRARLKAWETLDRKLRAEARQRRPAPAGPNAPLTTPPAAAPDHWVSIGPRPIGPTGNPKAGRVTAIAIDPRDSNILYAGGAEGGVWKTTDGGQNWTPLTDQQPSLATGAIALDPRQPDTVYVATGEGNFSGDSYYGAGILKSTDGGQTWTNIQEPFVSPTSGGTHITAMAIHPLRTNVLLVTCGSACSSGSGIYRSNDGAQSWTLVQAGANPTSIVFDPVSPETVYAAFGLPGGAAGNGIYKSTDGGLTWQLSNGSGGSAFPGGKLVGRITLAIAPSSPNVLYAMAQDASTDHYGHLFGLYKSLNAGADWTKLADVPDVCNAQCWYNEVLRVSPANPDLVLMGGVFLAGSVDGGISFTDIQSSLHVDHHALEYAPDGKKLVIGNDGGVWSTTEVSTLPFAWTNLNATLAIAEFSPALSVHPANAGETYAGTQDNNVLHFTGNYTWDPVTCGDGGWTVVDQALPAQAYAACQEIDIRKEPLPGSGQTAWTKIAGGIDQSQPQAFYAPLVGDSSNSLRLYFGASSLYRSNDGGGSWYPASPKFGTYIRAVGVAPSNPDVVYAGLNDGTMWVTQNATSAAPTWSGISTSLPTRVITQIAVDFNDAQTAYVTYSGFARSGGVPGHIFKTSNSGGSWIDVTGDLADIPVNDLVLDPDLPGTMYLATDAGVYLSSDSGQTWRTLVTGLPRVVVIGMKLQRSARILRAATHGRSMWDLALPLPSGASGGPVISHVTPAGANAGDGDTLVTLDGSNFGQNAVLRWNGVVLPTSVASATRLTATVPAASLGGAGRGTLTVFSPGAGISNPVAFPIGPAPVIVANGFVSAASPMAGTIAPGSIVSVYGLHLASALGSAAPGNLPFTLNNAQLVIGGLSAPIFFTSPGQMNVQIPWQLGSGTYAATVYVDQQPSGAVNLNVAPYAPTLFSLNQQGTGQGAILIANTATMAQPGTPAQPGGFVEIYATGLGAVTPPQANGVLSPTATVVRTKLTPVVTIGGQQANVTFSGLAPGTVGLYQIDAQVPVGVSGDAVPVTVTLNGVQSNTVTLAVAAQGSL